MAKECCPTCGRAFKAAKPAVQVPIDPASMSDAELFAHYKKLAPIEDVRFALRAEVPLSPQLRDDWQALLGLAPTLPTAESKRRLLTLQARWRAESNGRRPGVGSPAWNTRQDRIKARRVAEEALQRYLAPMRYASERDRKYRGNYRGRLDAKRLVA